MAREDTTLALNRRNPVAVKRDPSLPQSLTSTQISNQPRKVSATKSFQYFVFSFLVA